MGMGEWARASVCCTLYPMPETVVEDLEGWQVLSIVHHTLCMVPLGWRAWASWLCPSWLLALLIGWEI